jgi:hypothetical protein
VAGVYGLANGAGAATNNVGVYGKAFGSTVSNRAGYFWVNNSVDNDWIAEFYNKSTDSNADGIAIKINVATPGNNNNYVQFNKDSSAVGNIDGDGAGGVRYNTSGADFAEYFPAAENVEAGQLVSLNRDGKVQRAQPGDKPFGVVSSGGAFVGGKNYHPTSEDKSVLVALLGQVPVAVNNEKGAILPGDKIALSSQTGIGCKAQAGEDYVGIALEPLTNASGQIKVLVSVLASD